MKIIYDPVVLKHKIGYHIENEKRLLSLLPLKETNVASGEEYINLVHDEQYINKVIEACKSLVRFDDDTNICVDSYEAAIHAVGATILASQTNGFAAVRPPGHHAPFGGFCLFNNIAIAAKLLANDKKKVLILDMDGHFGNGTYELTKESNNIFYWSLHEFGKNIYPQCGDIDYVGVGPGKGYSINIPLPQGVGDDLYMEVFNRFLPFAKNFKPDIVGVSAGFDAHKDDFVLNLKLTDNSFYEIGKILSENFGNVFAVLEGGYNLDVLQGSISNFIKGINQQPIESKMERTTTNPRIITALEPKLVTLEDTIHQIKQSE